MTKTILAASIAILSLAGIVSAEARTYAPMRQAGTLSCTLNPGVGLVFGSAREVGCSYAFYDRRGHVVRETYTGRMDRAGIDLGLTSEQTVSWAVITPGGHSYPGMLARAFGGASADATIVVGAGTRSLFDQAGQPVVLTPVGNSGQIGVGFGFGATALGLQQVPNASYTSYRY